MSRKNITEDLLQLTREIIPGLTEEDYKQVANEVSTRIANISNSLIKTSSRKYETQLISTILDILDKENLVVTANVETFVPAKIVVCSEDELDALDINKIYREMDSVKLASTAKDDYLEQFEEMTPKTERVYDEAAKCYVDQKTNDEDEEGLWDALVEEHERQVGDATAEMNKSIKRHRNDFSQA